MDMPNTTRRPATEAQPEALPGPVGAGGKVGDAESFCGGSEKSRRWRHAIEKTQYFQLRFQLVGNGVNHQVGIAHRVFNAVGKAQPGRHRILRPGCCLPEITREYIFEHRVEPGQTAPDGKCHSIDRR
jgi:hypothetical protein